MAYITKRGFLLGDDGGGDGSGDGTGDGSAAPSDSAPSDAAAPPSDAALPSQDVALDTAPPVDSPPPPVDEPVQTVVITGSRGGSDTPPADAQPQDIGGDAPATTPPPPVQQVVITGKRAAPIDLTPAVMAPSIALPILDTRGQDVALDISHHDVLPTVDTLPTEPAFTGGRGATGATSRFTITRGAVIEPALFASDRASVSITSPGTNAPQSYAAQPYGSGSRQFQSDVALDSGADSSTPAKSGWLIFAAIVAAVLSQSQ